MSIKDFKYIAAYIIPVLAFLGIYHGGVWSYSTFLFAFLVIPFLELFIAPDPVNLSEQEATIKESNLFFDLLLYLNIPIVFGLLVFYLESMALGNYSLAESFGITLGMGIVLGSNGINVAHEIGHRDSKFQKLLSKMLLMPSLYMHFIIEHNLGHHKNVGTPEDAATARYNENLFAFWLRSVRQAYLNAWRIENRRLTQNGHSSFSWRNEMIWFLIIQLSFMALILWNYGWIVFGFYMYAAVMGFLLLETINYIEHYGLLRMKNKNGRYERVEHFHSWNSNHDLGRIFLYELTRHSDHHYKANKKYQVLRSYEDSPQLPFGYPGSMFIAFIPPLWFAIMNKRVPSSMKLQLKDGTS